MRYRAFFFSICAALTCDARLAHAQNSQVTPAPIAYPYFEAGRQDIKLTYNHFSIDGSKIGFKVAGSGLNGIYRKAFSDKVALDLNLGGNLVGGDFLTQTLVVKPGGFDFVDDNQSIDGYSISSSINLELQVFHSAKASLILFAGGLADFSSLSMTSKTQQYTSNDGTSHFYGNDMWMLTGGGQFGAQAGVLVGPCRLVPYAMMTAQTGTEWNDSPFIDNVEAITIDPFTSTSMGMDIVYEPWNLSIGSALQQVAGNKDDGDFKTRSFQISWHR